MLSCLMVSIVYAECLNLARYAECRYTKKRPAINKCPSLYLPSNGIDTCSEAGAVVSAAPAAETAAAAPKAARHDREDEEQGGYTQHHLLSML